MLSEGFTTNAICKVLMFSKKCPKFQYWWLAQLCEAIFSMRCLWKLNCLTRTASSMRRVLSITLPIQYTSQLWVDQSGEKIVKAHVWAPRAFAASPAYFFFELYFVCFKMERSPLNVQILGAGWWISTYSICSKAMVLGRGLDQV